MQSKSITTLIQPRRRIGWTLIRLHITRRGAGFEARIGWHASDLGLEPSQTIDPVAGVSAYEWQAPDDDIIPIASWSTAEMRTLCQALGIAEFDYQQGGSHEAWLAKTR